MNLSKPQKLIYDMEKFAGGAISNICGSILCEGNRTAVEITAAINDLHRLNDALRITVSEENGIVSQTINTYKEQIFEQISFETKEDFTAYAENYAKEPVDMYGSLCDVKIVFVDGKYGILVKMHHLIGDAWSLALIGSQLNALLNHKTPETYSYTDYLETEKKYIDSKRYTKDKAFFLEQFKKCDEVTYLSEKNSNSYVASRKTFVIDKEKTTAINNYCNKNEISTFSLLMSALGVYFNRTHMNAEHFYVGTAVLNRTSYKEKNIAGMFINTVPVLLELNNDQSFKQNSESIQDGLLSVLRHQKYNYGDILADIRDEFNFTEKLYDVMLSYQNAQIIGDDNFESAWYHCGMQTETLQIHIDDRDNEGVLEIHYDYLTDKLSEKEICRMHEHIFNLLFDGIENDGKKIYDLNILSKDEKQKLLFDFNDTAVDYPKDKLVHQLFEEQAEKTPDKDAVIACDKTLTYKELNEEANRIAHSLIEKGIGVGNIVAFALPRKSYLISTMLGILKSGAAYLPIDPDYPQDRIEYMLKDSQAKLCITEDNIADLLDNENAQNPCINMANDNICYCIYTSGSTGKPKGTLLTHKNVVNYCQKNNNNDVIQKIVKNDYRSIVSVTTVGFDIFVTESLFPLLNGLKIVFANEQQSRMQKDLSELLIAHPVDVMQTTPTKMKSLISNTRELDYLGKLKAIILGGEVLDKALVETLQGITTAKIFNIYGPTEATVWVTNTEVINANDITIGRPIANTQIYVVDKHMKTAPIGVTGELCIAGDCIGAGYLNRPELTAEKFIDNPFGEGKLYKTGDLAYWREDGNIVYVGRNDFQVKIRGLRIELGEIENAISSIDGISQCVVVVRKNAEGRQLICAFYTGKEAEAKEIRKTIGTKLPKYMIPHIFTHIDEMPLTSSGKVNRKALPDVDLENIINDTEYITPKTDQQKAICSTVQELLKIDRVGIKDNFIDLGGDSLKAIELVSKLSAIGYQAEVKDILNSVDFEVLADAVVQTNSNDSFFDYDGDIPATAAQMRVYTAQSLDENSTLYNVPYAFRVESVDIERLQEAINTLVDRHETLRTQFENRDGQIIQVLNNNAICKIEQLNTDNISSFIRPFNLAKAPLLRVGVYRNTIMVDMHHIITDGSSMPIFFNELNELYMGRELASKPVQYKQFALDKQDLSADEKFWTNVFNDEIPVLEINTDYPRGQKQSFKGNAIYEKIDIDLHNRIREKCKQLNITPFVFYMAGFSIFLSKFSGNEDIVIGIPVAGRSSKYLNTIGMFVNTVALRTQPKGNKTVDEYLRAVKHISLSSMEHQNYPFGELVKQLNIESSERNPLFDVMFAYQDKSMTDIVFGDKKAELLPTPITTSKCDFTFNIMPRDNDVVLMAEYCTDLYKEQTLKRMIAGYVQILNQMLNTTQNISVLTAITSEEKQKLLYDFNDTAADYPKDKLVHQLFEEQAEKTPDKVAVIACDKTLTYKELNEEANRVAHRLIEKGVCVGDIVAFVLPRKSYLISTILGILKSGAAYLPIDLDYPQDRIEYMLGDSSAKLCVTKESVAELLENDKTENPCIETTSDNICYCIYTSGSTGKPKGVRIKHRNLVNFVNVNDYNTHTRIIKNGNILLSTFKNCFDAFNVDFALILTNGKTIFLVEDDCLLNAEKLAAIINSQNIDIIHSTPSIISILSDNKLYSIALNNVKCILLGAESFSKQLYSKLSDITDAELINGYGPSETTIGVTFSQVNSEIINIGKPISNTQIYIVNQYLQPTPIGVTGELCIAGDCVGAGYLNRPELTADRFIDNPFGKGKLYKTGDLAYWREDGNIAYVGRNDFQVKIRGLRIELGEIENAISSIDEISQCVVVVRKNSEGRQLICAFYTGEELNAKDIRKTIGEELPKYMIPHIFVRLDEMPLTSSGKANRNAIPEIDLENIENINEYIAPENDQQKELCASMSCVLNIPKIGINDSFFELGCDSLKAIEFVSMAHKKNIVFSLQSVYDYSTIKELDNHINTKNKSNIQYDDTDFTRIHQLISTECKNTPSIIDVGDILITGANGFLGIHILAEYLQNDKGIAYCVVRAETKRKAYDRLLHCLHYYFSDTYDYLIGSRIIVICGDITQKNFGVKDIPKIDTIIHTAAIVKHYGSYNVFETINVSGTINALEIAKQKNARFIHISTTSISGYMDVFDNYQRADKKWFSEKDFYIHQPLNNVYIRSKFEAEREVYNAVLNGVRANVIRVGNLTNRASDLKFQENYESSAFLKRAKALLEFGYIPDYIKNLQCEFSPIDNTAKAVMTIARHFNLQQIVFHASSDKEISFARCCEIAKCNNVKYEYVNESTFKEKISTIKEQNNYVYESLINDMDENGKLVYDANVYINRDTTINYLNKLGFEWTDIDYDYITRYIEYFRQLGFLEA